MITIRRKLVFVYYEPKILSWVHSERINQEVKYIKIL